ncbi:xanthine dehydrogenase family protein molybdopterin-binding subunit [Actinokineospora guangxiensis]|uniref:Xanthine dehydrogenase family protein molybdopterin-binding subunit n=1 Tax=Actinokineospora guangxiensis TaxID=1490288 RepID=A0ABW0EQQ6_9PSEU
MSPAIGADLTRRDGIRKVTGTATYAYETSAEDTGVKAAPAYCHFVQSTVAKGRITGIAASAARAEPGVLAVLAAGEAERLADTEDRELAVLQDHAVGFRGQVVAVVVAETPETARHAAGLVAVEYAEDEHSADLASAPTYKPEEVNAGFPTDTSDGDVEAALAEASARVEQTYSTAMYHNNPIEPHATTALWTGGALTLWDSTQGVHSVRQIIRKVFGIEDVRVVCPFVGGGFGSKGEPHAHVVLAAMAARAVPDRPVKVALTRQQMFALAGYRPPTIQRMRLGADRDGRLTALSLDVVEMSSRTKEYAEQTAVPARMMYATPNRATTHRLAALDVPVPSWMRAPGECPGMFGPEVAMDELAEALGMDPIELRVRNEPETDPDSGLPYSSRNLVRCLREGAERFGWERRRTGVVDGWRVGSGVAASVYPVHRMPESTVRITYAAGRYLVEIGAADLGTGTWTTLAQIAADALGVPVRDVEVRIGDTDYPVASVAGGSSGMTTWGSAAYAAAEAFRREHGDDPADGESAEGSVPENPASEKYAMFAFGAQFAEVGVHADTGEIRVRRLHGTFAAGRVINPRTARSQFIGGMTMGLSMALHEQSVLDPRTGHVVNHDLAEYHIAVNADIADIQAHWIDEHDPHVNPMGSKGIGEIGIVGTAAAVANAVHAATGVRVRDLPITLDKI